MPSPTAGPSAGVRFVRDLAVLFGVPAVILAVVLWRWRPWTLGRYEVRPSEEIYDVVTGTWDWVSDSIPCGEQTHTIAFSPDHHLMILSSDVPWTGPDDRKHSRAEYEIREVSRSHVRAFMRGETRKTDDGRLVVWDLVLTSPNSYAWHRTDWAAFAMTDQITRCPSTIPPLGNRAGKSRNEAKQPE